MHLRGSAFSLYQSPSRMQAAVSLEIHCPRARNNGEHEGDAGRPEHVMPTFY